MKKFGLLGEHLGHSFSPMIHKAFGDYSYELFEVPPSKLEKFICSNYYDGLNVTIPYKQAVLPYLDEVSWRAKKIGSVNTIVYKNGKRIGDNTDYCGFRYMVESSGVSPAGKKVIVLGSGGASRAVCEAMKDLGCSELCVISRSGSDNYQNIEKHADAEIIVNATPVGMYPHNAESPLSLKSFSKLQAVLDLIYNPQKTALMLEAEQRKVIAVGGLSMLVSQAFFSAEQFMDQKLNPSLVAPLIQKIGMQMKNIVLIGMPGSGKSVCARMLSERLGRKWIDTDTRIEQQSGQTISEIFAANGEEHFRNLESEVIKRVSAETGCVISVGGGAILRRENQNALRQNGYFLWLCRPLSELSMSNRPLSTDKEALLRMEKERMPIYQSMADAKIHVSDSPELTLQKILEAVHYENTGN